MLRIPTDRRPTHPGEVLLEEFLEPLDMTPEGTRGCHSRAVSASQCNRQRATRRYAQHGAEAGEVFRQQCRLLDESSASI